MRNLTDGEEFDALRDLCAMSLTWYGSSRQVVAMIDALEQPWRDRFKRLTGYFAGRCPLNNGVPSSEQCETWLGEDLDLRRLVTRLLRRWVHE